MPNRMPVFADMFYPGDAQSCQRQIETFLDHVAPSELVRPVRAGLVPHAGWVYSGQTAAYTFAAMRDIAPETIILLGAVHRWGVSAASLYGRGSWQTPMGRVEIDEGLAQEIIIQSAGAIADNPSAHEGEHAIEVQVPFIQYLFPHSAILPIAVPPIRDAHIMGHSIARAVRQAGRRAIAIASSDLTHYGPRYGMAPAGTGEPALAWTRENDKLILDLAARMAEDEIVAEARAHRNACGSGALAVAIGYALEQQAEEGLLLHYTTSYDVMPTGRPTDMVGYGAMVFA